MKTFLYPLKVRRGQPVNVFVSKEPITGLIDSKAWSYWLGVYHDFRGRGKPAVMTDYHAVSRQAISQELYESLLAEAKRNTQKYR